MLSWVLCSVLWVSVAAKQPHILYVIADDMGWSDVGFTQGMDIQLNCHQFQSFTFYSTLRSHYFKIEQRNILGHAPNLN